MLSIFTRSFSRSSALAGVSLILVLSSHAKAASQTIFAASTSGHDRFYSVSFDAQGNFYAVGSVADGILKTDDQKTLVAKYLNDGQLDVTFGVGGYAIFNLAVGADGESARAVVVDSEGRVLVGGTIEHAGATDIRDRDVYVIRVNPVNGTLDSTWGTVGVSVLDFGAGVENGTSYTADGFGGLALDPSGRLIVEGLQKRVDGLDSDFVIARLDANGALDTTYGTNGTFTFDRDNLGASAKTPVVLPTGEVFGTGYSRRGSITFPIIFKLDPNGLLDTTYGDKGAFTTPALAGSTEIYSAVLQNDSLVTVGYGKSSETDNLDVVSLRVNAKGVLDTTYGTNGFVRSDVDGFNDNGRNMASLPDGRHLLVGGGRYSSANVDGLALMLNADGSADESFGEKGQQLFDLGGASDFFWGVAISPAGDKAVLAGIKGVGTNPGNDDAAIVVIDLKK